MAFTLTWLPDVLKAAGLKVSTIDGWETRGRGDVGHIFGVICHHTAGPLKGNMPSMRTLINGRPDLPGPLAQLGLARDGSYIVIAAGRCNHAGKGIWRGIVNANSNFIGIEAENTGLPNDFPWPAVQIDAYHRGVAAILKRIGRGPEFCAGHKEYALPIGRKDDADFDMDAFRLSVAAIINGSAPPPVLIPPVEPSPPPGVQPRPTLRRGASGDLVKQIQAKVGVNADGKFGPKTEAAVRAFQREHGLVPDGIVGPKSWTALDKV
jgi:peptidoglycan hydrolase-like protein with peptidoglycan-binding domain